MSIDPPAALLRRLVAVLPDRFAEWGAAMQAELAAIGGTRPRWGFVLGCARAVLLRPWGLPAAGWLVLRLLVVTGSVASALVMADRIQVPSTRLEAVTAVGVLVVLAVLARSNWAGYGPVLPACSVRVVAVCGAALVVLETVLSLRRLGADPPLTLPWNAHGWGSRHRTRRREAHLARSLAWASI